jgi:hypothetical protein
MVLDPYSGNTSSTEDCRVFNSPKPRAIAAGLPAAGFDEIINGLFVATKNNPVIYKKSRDYF